jgi:hypothetical protein
MAFSYGGQRASATTKTTGTTLDATPTQTIGVGALLVVLVASDNQSTTAGATTAMSVSDAQGNAYTRRAEYTQTAGASADGVTVGIFTSVLGTALTTSDYVRLTSNNVPSRQIVVHEFATSGLDGVTSAGVDRGAGTAPTAALSGLTSRPYLLIGAVGVENKANITFTQDTDYSDLGAAWVGQTDGGAASCTAVRGGYRTATLTADTYAPTIATSDWSCALVGLYEAAASNATVSASVAAATAQAKRPGVYAGWGSLLFADTFESGDFSAWDGTYTLNGGQATVQGTTVFEGAYAARFDIGSQNSGDANCWRNQAFPASNQITIDGWYYWLDREASFDGDIRLMALWNGTDDVPLASVEYDHLNEYYLRVHKRDNTAATVAFSTQGPEYQTWGRLRLCFDTSGTNPIASVYLNNTLVASYEDTSSGTVRVPDQYYHCAKNWVGSYQGIVLFDRAAAWDSAPQATTAATIAGAVALATAQGCTPSVAAGGLLLLDTFTTADPNPLVAPRTAEPGPGTLAITDNDAQLSIASGRLLVGDSDTGTWTDTFVASGALTDLRAAAVAVRFQGQTTAAPAIALRPNATPFDPTSTGARQGLYYAAPNALYVLGNGDFSALMANHVATRRVASVDTTFLLVRRPGGGVLVAAVGGVLGTYTAGLPATATLLIVGDTDAIGVGDAYLTLAARQGALQVQGLTALREAGLGTEYAGRFPLAVAGDDFARGDGTLTGDSTPTGTLAYALIGGWSIASGAAVATAFDSGTAQLTVTPAARPRFIDARITMAAATKADAGITFRHNGTRGLQYWSDGSTEGVYDPANATPLWQQSWGHTLGQTYSIAIEDNGTHFRLFRDNVMLVDWTTIPVAYATDKGCGPILWSDDAGSQIAEWGCWPESVPLDSALVLVEALPDAVGDARASDAFTASDGTALATHNAAWSTEGTWEVRSGKAQMTAAGATGFATRDAQTAEHKVVATITLPSVTPGVGEDWNCGLVARYADADNHLLARFLYQANSPEIELWQYVAGVSSLIGFVNLGAGALVASASHTLSLAVHDGECAVHLDDALVLQAETALLTGTRVGLAVEGTQTVGQPAWDDFSVYATGEITSTNVTVTPPAAASSAQALLPTVVAVFSKTIVGAAAQASAQALLPTAGTSTNATVAGSVADAAAGALAPGAFTANYYEVQRKTGAEGTYATLALVPIGTLAYDDHTIEGGSSYVYRVRRVKDNVAHPWSNEQPSGDVSLNATVVAAKAPALAFGQAPTMAVTRAKTVVAVAAPAQGAAPAPSVSATHTVTVVGSAAQATAQAPLPGVATSAVIALVLQGAVLASAQAPLPTVLPTSNATITASVASSAAGVSLPTMAVVQNKAIAGSVATSAAGALLPLALTTKNVTALSPMAIASAAASAATVLTAGMVSVAGALAQAQAQATVPTLSAVANATVTGAPALAQAQAPVPGVLAAQNATPSAPAAQAQAQVLLPAASTTQQVSVLATVAPALAGALTPAVLTAGAAVVQGARAQASAQAPAPGLSTTALLGGVVALGAGQALLPTISATRVATLQPPAAQGAAQTPAPAVLTAGSVSVFALAATAQGLAPTPALALDARILATTALAQGLALQGEPGAGTTVVAAPATAQAQAPVHGVSTAGNALALAPAALAQAMAPLPTPRAGTLIQALNALASAQAPAPALSLGARLGGALAQALAEALLPGLSLGATVSPPVALAQARVEGVIKPEDALVGGAPALAQALTPLPALIAGRGPRLAAPSASAQGLAQAPALGIEIVLGPGAARALAGGLSPTVTAVIETVPGIVVLRDSATGVSLGDAVASQITLADAAAYTIILRDTIS